MIYRDKNFKPMLLSEIDKPFNDDEYIFEIKYDGIRALVFAEKNKILIKSRNGNILNSYYPELLSINKNIKNKVIFDGEIVVLKNGKPSFKDLQKRSRVKNKDKIIQLSAHYPVIFMCFDILYENNDLTQLPLIERKKILEKYNNTDYFVKTKYINSNGILLFNSIKKMKLEGIVAKNKKSIYEINNRSKNWIKIKNLKDEDFFICGYKENDNNTATLLLGKKINNDFKISGKVALGRNKNDFTIIKNCKIINDKMFEKENYVFIEPKLQCTVQFTEKTNGNSLRHAIYKCLKLN